MTNHNTGPYTRACVNILEIKCVETMEVTRNYKLGQCTNDLSSSLWSYTGQVLLMRFYIKLYKTFKPYKAAKDPETDK